MLVSKLRGARERKKAATGKCDGRKSWAEINPELVHQANRLRRRSPKGHQRSLRDVAAELAKLGFVNERGVEFCGLDAGHLTGGQLIFRNPPSDQRTCFRIFPWCSCLFER